MTEGGEKQHEAKIHKSLMTVASHAEVLRGSAGTRDEPLRTSAWEAMITAGIRLRVFPRFDLKMIYFCWKKRSSS